MTTDNLISSLDDDGKLRRRFVNKRVNAKKEGIAFLLSRHEFCQLMLEAKIQSSDLGIRGFHLARLGDKGAYEVGNCRFIFYKENYAERALSEASIQASRRNVQSATAALRNAPREMWKQTALKRKSNGTDKGGWNKLSETHLENLRELIKDVDLSAWGSKVKVALIWGCSPQHAGRLLVRLGLSGCSSAR